MDVHMTWLISNLSEPAFLYPRRFYMWGTKLGGSISDWQWARWEACLLRLSPCLSLMGGRDELVAGQLLSELLVPMYSYTFEGPPSQAVVQ